MGKPNKDQQSKRELTQQRTERWRRRKEVEKEYCEILCKFGKDPLKYNVCTEHTKVLHRQLIQQIFKFPSRSKFYKSLRMAELVGLKIMSIACRTYSRQNWLNLYSGISLETDRPRFEHQNSIWRRLQTWFTSSCSVLWSPVYLSVSLCGVNILIGFLCSDILIMCSFFNLLKTERNLLYIRNQSVPRSKHFPPRL